MKLLVTIFILFQAFAASAQNCAEIFRELLVEEAVESIKARGAFHSTITFRPGLDTSDPKSYLSRLGDCPSVGVNGAIVPFPRLEQFTEGKVTLLDVGAGNADFVPALLDLAGPEARKNIHAVDARYQDKVSLDGVSQAIRDLIRAYPENFHGQMVQDIEIRRGGTVIFFDEIVSSSSLNFVIKKASTQEVMGILSALVRQLKPGGRLRIWSDPDQFWKPHGDAIKVFNQIEPVVIQMLAEGLISNYSIPTRTDDVNIIVR